jgi:hypothetical protein
MSRVVDRRTSVAARAADREVVTSHPAWWLEHFDEPEAGLAEAVCDREPLPQRPGRAEG